MRLVDALVPLMQRRAGGAIVNMTSQLGIASKPARRPVRIGAADAIRDPGTPPPPHAPAAIGALRQLGPAYRDFVTHGPWTLASLANGDVTVPLIPADLRGSYGAYSVSKALVNRITELQAQVQARAGACGVPGLAELTGARRSWSTKSFGTGVRRG